jgi:hypothetical protein
MADAERPAGRRPGLWRRVLGRILLGLAVLAIILGPILLYVRVELLNSSTFTNRAETALASSDVQDYLANALTTNLVAKGGETVQRAEPLIRAVAGGVVSSNAFQSVFGTAVTALHKRMLDEGTADRVLNLKQAVDKVVNAVAVVSPSTAARIRSASGTIKLNESTTGKRIAQLAHRLQQVRVLGIVMPIVAFVLLAISVALGQDRIRSLRHAGWALIAGGAVVIVAASLIHRVLVSLVDTEEVRRAVGETEEAFLGDLSTWGTWLAAIGVVVTFVAVFLASPLSLREHAGQVWGFISRPPRKTWGDALRLLLLVVVVLCFIFAFGAVIRIAVAIIVGALVAWFLVRIMRLAGVKAGAGERAFTG